MVEPTGVTSRSSIALERIMGSARGSSTADSTGAGRIRLTFGVTILAATPLEFVIGRLGGSPRRKALGVRRLLGRGSRRD
jgi:hypothetical protein